MSHSNIVLTRIDHFQAYILMDVQPIPMSMRIVRPTQDSVVTRPIKHGVPQLVHPTKAWLSDSSSPLKNDPLRAW
jgi:hypothetical protein